MPSISKITLDNTTYDIKDPQVQELSDNLDSLIDYNTNQYGRADAYADEDGIYKVTINVLDGHDALAFYIDGTCTEYSFDKTTWQEPLTQKIGITNLEGKVMYLKGENITEMYYMTASNKSYLGSIKGLASQILLDNNPTYSSFATIFMNLCGGGVFDEDVPLLVLSDTIAEWANVKFAQLSTTDGLTARLDALEKDAPEAYNNLKKIGEAIVAHGQSVTAIQSRLDNIAVTVASGNYQVDKQASTGEWYDSSLKLTLAAGQTLQRTASSPGDILVLDASTMKQLAELSAWIPTYTATQAVNVYLCGASYYGTESKGTYKVKVKKTLEEALDMLGGI